MTDESLQELKIAHYLSQLIYSASKVHTCWLAYYKNKTNTGAQNKDKKHGQKFLD